MSLDGPLWRTVVPSNVSLAQLLPLSECSLMMIYKNLTKYSSTDPYDGPSCPRRIVYRSVTQCCNCCTAIPFLFLLCCFLLLHVLVLIDIFACINSTKTRPHLLTRAFQVLRLVHLDGHRLKGWAWPRVRSTRILTSTRLHAPPEPHPQRWHPEESLPPILKRNAFLSAHLLGLLDSLREHLAPRISSGSEEVYGSK